MTGPWLIEAEEVKSCRRIVLGPGKVSGFKLAPILWSASSLAWVT